MEKKKKGLSAWQLTMLALGTVVGGSFFLGSSVAIHAAGPAVLISYILGGVLVYFILTALSEMTVANPGAGSFRAFAAEQFGPGAGFVVGWVYWTGLTLGMSSEATAVSILLRLWLPRVPVALLGSAVIIGVTLLNLLGAKKLSSLESGLAAVKIAAIVSFIGVAVLLTAGLFPGRAGAVGAGSLRGEALFPGGLGSLAGSMLIVMFAYAGFEIIGLAASEAENPRVTVPAAIRRTVVILTGLYILSAAALLVLIPTAQLSPSVSPMVAALDRHGIGWAGAALNVVLVTAILSTMLASMFGLGRMIRSLAADGLAPAFLSEKRDVPVRGILFSGAGMLAGLGLGLLFPSVYLFLVSAGGFAMLFTYAVIMATHIRFRRRFGCPPDGRCQLRGFPYTSVIVLVLLIGAIASMPLVAGQATGLVAGCVTVAFYTGCYAVMKGARKLPARGVRGSYSHTVRRVRSRYAQEASRALAEMEEKAKRKNGKDKK